MSSSAFCHCYLHSLRALYDSLLSDILLQAASIRAKYAADCQHGDMSHFALATYAKPERQFSLISVVAQEVLINVREQRRDRASKDAFALRTTRQLMIARR